MIQQADAPQMGGLFVTLEGGEGCGKSTQARLLVEALARFGHAVLGTREPGGSPGAETLRGLLLSGSHPWSPAAEAHLHFAARAEHLARTILPALAAGTVVVSDRFADSTLAYQGYGQGADRSLIDGLVRLLPRQPDLTLVLQVTPSIAFGRVRSRAQALDHYESMGDAFHARVAQGFAEIAAANPDRCRVIDASGSVEAVHAAILAEALARLGGFP